jgi:UDP-N-acetyl-D-glucosamine dehydrogenase
LETGETGAPTVGIIGLGYVGLSYAVAFAQVGCTVIGCDVLPARVAAINRGESPLPDILPDAAVGAQVAVGRLTATTEDAPLAACDALIIAVPTPVNATYDPDLSMVRDATERIGRVLRRGQLIILECTTYPGTTEEIIVPMVEGRGFMIGTEVFVAYSPERIDPGNTNSQGWTLRNTPKVVGGCTPACTQRAVALYRRMTDTVIPVSSPRVAEMEKLVENVFRVVNIALVDELALLCDRMGMDIWEVLDAAGTKPYGFMRFVPGPGLGGHCIPVDPLYLTWKAKAYNFPTRFIELAVEIDRRMPYHVHELTVRALNGQKKSVNGSRILLLGVAYKPDVADTRETPAAPIWQLLEAGGATVCYHDPHVLAFRTVDGAEQRSVALTDEVLRSADCVVIVTDHSAVDYQRVVDRARAVVDTRGVTRGCTLAEGSAAITRL